MPPTSHAVSFPTWRFQQSPTFPSASRPEPPTTVVAGFVSGTARRSCRRSWKLAGSVAGPQVSDDPDRHPVVDATPPRKVSSQYLATRRIQVPLSRCRFCRASRKIGTAHVLGEIGCYLGLGSESRLRGHLSTCAWLSLSCVRRFSISAEETLDV